MPKDKPKRPAPFQVQGINDALKYRFNMYAAFNRLSRTKLLTQMIESLPELVHDNPHDKAQDEPQKKSS